ncbi:MAG: PspC domain-containing protein [Bacteroidaceae bacterium]|nr:PspC domain-containing protein [Bacteroidaceae bacterium]
MEERRFYLSSTDKKIGGVCGGIAEYFGIDPLLVRVGFLFLFFGMGCGLLLYILLWILAPRSDRQNGYQK